MIFSCTLHSYPTDDTMDVLPVIADQPTSQSASYGEEVTLCVSATGTGSLSYYWIKDGDAYFGEKLSHCTGSNTSSLHISAFSPSHEGRYKCVVSNKAGSVESNTVTLSGEYSSAIANTLINLIWYHG